MTSATERLRALLDERGVEYRVSATGYSIDIGPNVTAYANRTDTTLDVSLRGYTPEQAVTATLGPGTCKPVISDNLNESEGAGDAWADCSACGHLLFVLTDPNSQPPNYCPNCGRLVERGDES